MPGQAGESYGRSLTKRANAYPPLGGQAEQGLYSSSHSSGFHIPVLPCNTHTKHFNRQARVAPSGGSARVSGRVRKRPAVVK